jgi:NAD(P)-dependent dehydrogenase (short-subunit alcohol dehydrogenase family)
MSSALDGKVALVTGGGSGLGAATCKALVNEGATVIVSDVRAELSQKVAVELNPRTRASAIALDVRSEESVRNAVEHTVSEHGSLDIVVNNAGVDRTVAFQDLSVQEWDEVLGVNLRGPFITAKYAFDVMSKAGRGHIVNIVSTAAKRAWPNASAYHASKWGLLGLSHAIHTEARPLGIKVTAVIAGGMRTPFLLDRFPDIDVGTLQEPDNVARTIVFVLTQPAETVVPEVMVVPMRESSWP